MKLVTMSYVLIGLMLVGCVDSAFAAGRKGSRRTTPSRAEKGDESKDVTPPAPSKLKGTQSSAEDSDMLAADASGEKVAGDVALAESRKGLAALPAAIVAITGEDGSVNLKELRKLGKVAIKQLECLVLLDGALDEKARARYSAFVANLETETKKRTTLDGAAVVKLLADCAEDFAPKAAASTGGSVNTSKVGKPTASGDAKKLGRVAELWAKMPSRASMRERVSAMPSLSRKAKYQVGGAVLCGTCVVVGVCTGYIDPMAIATGVRAAVCACPA